MDIETIIEWIFSNVLWELLIAFLVVFLSLFKVILISWKLLSQNRDTRGGNGWGKHFADRFIDVWYSKEKEPLRQSTEMYRMNNNPNSRYWIKYIDEQLQNWGLISLLTTSDGNIVKPIRSWRNRIILFISEFWLINIIGDNRNFYKELKRMLNIK